MTHTVPRRTPGSHVTEPDAFPPSIAGVQTAIPAFIGYTETATQDGQSVSKKPIQIGSLSEFVSIFGDGSRERFNLYNALRLFYANGGRGCYVVSVGGYDSPPSYDDLRSGLDAIKDQVGPTMLVIPDALSLDAERFGALAQAQLDQAAELGDRFAILDVHGILDVKDGPDAGHELADLVAAFRKTVTRSLSYGAAYAPALVTDQGVLPPSGAIAGIYSNTDSTRGVWNAPANVSVASVLRPSIQITDTQQEDLNVPLDGKAINAIREFVGRGTVVWGARTLDGNSDDYRYIQVRRTIIYIEQSIKSALDRFVFAANDGNTWVAVVSMISNFLQTLWSNGGLMGPTASEAFSVACGLGSTMTVQDILDGWMIVQVTLQLIRPAEFIELTFKQKMQGR